MAINDDNEFTAIVDQLFDGAKETNEFIPIVDQVFNNEHQKVANNVEVATQFNPEDAAFTQKLSSQLNVNADVLERNLKQAKALAARQQLMNVSQANNSPAVTKYYSNFDNAKLSHDDIEQMTHSANTAEKIKRVQQTYKNIQSAAVTTGKGVYGALAGGTLMAEQAASSILAAPFDILSYAGTDQLGQYDIPGKIGQYLGTLSSASAQQREDLARVLGFSEKSYAEDKVGYLPRMAYGAGESIQQYLMTAPFALEQQLVSKAPAAVQLFKSLLPMGALTAGQSYQEAKAQGVNPLSAALYGTSQGAVEMATEAFPLGKLVRDVKMTAPLWKVLRNQLVTENIGEQAATALQDLNAWAMLPENADKTFGDYLAERPSAALDTAVQTSIATLIQTPVMRAAVLSERKNMTHQQLAVEAESNFNELVTSIRETKTNKRNPAAVQSMLNDVGIGDVYIDARTAAQILNQSQLQQLASPEELQTAIDTQGDLIIPGSKLAVVVANDESMQPILEHTRYSDAEDSLTPVQAREAEAKKQELIKQHGQISAESEKILTDAQTEKEFVDSASELESTIHGQIKATGQYAPEASKAYSKSVQAFYVTKAKELGMKPMDLYKLLPYNVTTGSFEQQQVSMLQQVPANNKLDIQHTRTGLSGSAIANLEFLAEGSESTVYRNGNKVIKISEPYSDQSEETYLERINNALLIDRLVGNGTLTHIGFYESENGTKNPVFEQQYIEGAAANREQIKAHLEAKGFSVKESGTYTDVFSKTLPDGTEVIVRDLDGDNVKIDVNGQAHVIDASLQFKNKSKDFAAQNYLYQSATIRSGQETLESFGLDPTKKYKTREVAAALENRQRNLYGSIAANDRSTDALDKIASWMQAEVEFEMINPGKSGVGWYSQKFQNALDIMGNAFPELKTDKAARNLMTALIAITSDGQKVVPNFTQAMQFYDSFRQTGKFTSTKGHQRQKSINNNIKNLQRLYDSMGPIALHTYLMQEDTISNLKQIAKQRGTKLKSDYQAHIKMPMAVVEFGPKLGAFYANLMGAHGYLTMDRWWSRTFNRYRGTLLTAPTKVGLERFKKLIGKPELSDDEAIAATIQYRDSYEAKNFKRGTEIEKAANTIWKAAFDALEDAPFNAKDRTFMLDAVNKAQQNLAKSGYTLSVADIQAILWYYEKRLYGELGARQTADISYEDAAKRVVAEYAGGLNIPGNAGKSGTNQTGFAPAVSPGNEQFQGPDANAGMAGSQQAGDGGGRATSGRIAPLEGAPNVPGFNGPDPRIVQVAEQYAAENGIDLRRQSEYVSVDPERAERIAAAYAAMKHDPQNPKVKEAYQNLINQTIAQYRALEAAGYKFWFIDTSIPSNQEYANSPWNAMRDMRQNQQMGVFPTSEGFGSSDLDVSANPLLADTGIQWPVGGVNGPLRPVLANDLFRAVHDAFGHGMEGAGFRAQGEENAWQAHVRLFTGSAIGAITSETRGQNSWLNYGPHGEQNRNAKTADTIFADQKTGLMPKWTWTEGRAGDMPEPGATEQPGVLFQTAPVWKSILLESVQTAKIEKAPGNDWLNILKKSAKADEIEATDLAEFLEDRASVSKQEIVDYLNSNGVQVRETMLEANPEETVNLILANSGYYADFDTATEEWTFYDQMGDTIGFDELPEEYHSDLNDIERTKYQKYSFEKNRNYQELLLTLKTPKGKPFFGEHWEQKDVLAHIRFNDFTDNEGKRVLFIEEIQSDWGQAGRKDGFEQELGIRAAPFVTDTKAWTGLAVKRMMRYAADHGYARIAFINGGQASERFNLRHSIEWLSYEPKRGWLRGWDAMRNERVNKKGVKPEELEREIGKEAAAKLLATEQSFGGVHLLEGEQLEVGGAGMNGYYNGILPQVVSKIVGKFGAKPYLQNLGMPLHNVKQGGEQQQMVVDITPEMRTELKKPQPLFQQTEGVRGGFDPSTLTTIITKQSDMSTFLHETGHFYLEAMFRMAALPNATEQMKADAQTVLDWFGVTNLETWNSMSLEDQRKYHEQWAYNHEIYLYEGKAPSLKLQSIFDKFSAWLRQVYKSIVTDLNAIYRQQHGEDLPVLTGEVRQVMDRLMASDDQIAQAEEVRNMKPIFQTQEESGMDDAQWAEYQDLQTQSHDSSVSDLTKSTLRQMKWLSNARSKLLKTMQAKVNDVRKGVRVEAAKEVEARPVYRAIRFLRTGKLEDENGNPIEVQNGNKLNKGMVKAMYPEGALVPGPDMGKLRGMLSDDGLPPDMVAEIFGFTSGDDMVRAIAEAKPINQAIDDRTDERMLNEHSELMDPEVQARNIEQALHTEARARFVAVELRYLAKATQPVRVMLQAAKMAAQQIISGKKIKDIKPRDYSLAEARAAKKAEAHMKKGESKEAAQEKQGQLLQGQLAAEAVAARGEVEAALAKFKKFFRADKKIAKTRDMDLVNAARAILSAFGIGPKGKSPFDFVDQLRTYNPDLYAELEPLMFKAASGAVDYKQLTMEEFRAMKDAVDALWFNAKRDKQIMVEGQAVDLANVITQLNERLTQVGIPAEVAGERKAPTKMDRLVRAFNNTKAILRRVEHWADSLDGEAGPGAFTKFIWRPVKDALNSYRLARNDYVKRYAEMIQDLDLPVGIIEAPELGYSFGHGNGGIGKAELLGAILHTGNESNYKKLLVGRGWGVIREDGSLDTSRWDAFMARMIKEGHLTKKDFDFAQQVWDLNEEIKPLAQKAHHDMFGYYFKEVPNTPFSNQFGSYRGGYVPAKTDPFIVRDAQRQSKMEALESDFRNAMPSTGLGFTKGRVEYNKPLSLDVRQMTNHIDSVIRFALVQPAIKDALKILRNRGFADNLSRLDPSAIEDMLIPWLNRAARQITSEVGKSKFMDDIWRGIRQRTGIAIMFGNLRNALQQLTGYFPAAIKVKPGYLKSALASYMSNTQAVAEEVAELSPFMKDRLQSQIFDIQENMNDILLNPSKFDKLKKWTQQHGYFLQTAFQNQVDVVTWTATYNQTLAELGSDVSDEKAKKEAVQRADAAVRLTQSSLSAEDLAAFEVGTPFTKTLTHFGGYMNMMANLNVTAFTKVVRDLGWRGNKGKLLYVYLLGIALPALIGDAIMRSLGTGWDDDDDDGYLDEFMAWFFGSQGKMVTGMVPFAGQLATATYGALTTQQYDDKISISPSITALESAGGTIKAGINVASSDKELTGKNVRDVMTFLSLVTGVPMTVLGRPIGYAVDVNRGAVQPTSTYDLGRGLVTGVPSKESTGQ